MNPQDKNLRLKGIVIKVLSAFLLVSICLSTLPEKAQAAPPMIKDPTKCPYLHFVQKGETIGFIALKYGISVRELMEANTFFPPYKLAPWQPICIPRIKFERLFPQANFSANVFLNRITIMGIAFPFPYRFTVKVRTKNNGPWLKVGTLRAGWDGSLQGGFTLPKKVAQSNYFQVCLKEVEKGFVICKRVNNLQQSGKIIQWNGMKGIIPIQ